MRCTTRKITPFRARLGIAFGLLAMTFNAVAQPTPQAHLAKKTQASGVLRARLPNGLRVIIVQDHFAPVVRTQMIYHVGSAMAPDAFPGTAHALEHMMFNGSGAIQRGQLSAISALIGNRNNAFTTEDTTQYYFEAPARNLDLLLRIEADRMRDLLISEADWQRERGAIEQEVSRDLSMPIERFFIQQNQALFKGTPYAHDALGTRASFDRTDTARLRAFYETWYCPNNATLLIVGDVQPSAALTDVKQRFGGVPARALPPRPQINTQLPPAQTFNLKSDYASGLFVISFPAPGAQEKDSAATQILADSLNSERGALAALRARGEALYAAAFFEPRMKAGVLTVYAAYAKGADPQPLMRKVQAILNDVRLHSLPAALTAATKRKALTDLAESRNSLSGLASVWAEALAIDPNSSPEVRADDIAHVRDVDIATVANRILDPAHALTGIITPSAQGDPSGAQTRAPEHFLPPPEKDVPLPDWATRSLSRLEMPAKFPQPRVFKLDNGLTLYVRTEPSGHAVQLFGAIRNNALMQEPEGKEGVLDLTDSLFLFGSEQHDRVRFAEALDALGASADTGLRFSVTALDDKFDAAFRLMAEVERHPAFPTAGFLAIKQQDVASLPGLLNAPGYRFAQILKKKINPPGDPALREPSDASLKSLTRHDILETYRNIYRPDETTVVIIGNITAEHALELVKEAFGDWKNPGPARNIDLPPRPDNTPSAVYVGDPGRTQSDVTLIQTLRDGIHNPDRYALGFGSNVLGSGFNARLLQSLRVRTGLVYTVQSDLEWSPNRGAFVINYGADPDKAIKARDLALQDVSRMCLEPISGNELDTTKASLLRAMPMQRAGFDALAGTYLRLTALGLPLDEKDREARAVFDMQPKIVQAAFCRQIAPKRMVEAVFGPIKNAGPS